jgi:phosphate starvation-inducible protein PhoH and related proteins
MEEMTLPGHDETVFTPIFQKNLRHFEAIFGLQIALRGNKIMFDGSRSAILQFKKYVRQLSHLADENKALNEHDIQLSLNLVESGKIDSLREHVNHHYHFTVGGKEVQPKTFHQREYVRAIRNNTLVFGIGPAGTGKTFLAIAQALHFYFNKQVERIVLTRPVVEAGEKLGFLPGDLQQKINPYLRPLYDAFYFFIGFEKTSEYIEKNIIEIAPLAYMRGRTISNAFIILDEGQNTVDSQMKMFLTRFGQGSRVVITADVTQIDLDNPMKSGIHKAVRILRNLDDVEVVTLTEKDVVRHPLVQKIVHVYSQHPE